MTEHTQFRAVLRGYDPAQVDQVVAELTAAAEAARQEAAGLSVQASKLEAGHAELRSQLDARDAQLTKLREASRTAAAPSFAGLGDRVGQILTLADEEAAALRAASAAEAAELKASTESAAAAIRSDADRYAEDVRTKADADA
ncbi:MAG TPA: DivIVA domain-containing protein, partial [Vicinamibacterales bacterium]|nr:DivIVA domain-containing protein [Vicinamibacterales bacterium]